MPFFYILYILIKKIYIGAETSRAEPGKDRNLLGPNRKRAETSGIHTKLINTHMWPGGCYTRLETTSGLWREAHQTP